MRMNAPDRDDFKALNDLSLTDLRAEWERLSLHPAPRAFRQAMLADALSYEQQVQRYGGLSLSVKRRLRALAEAARNERFDQALGCSSLKPGTVLIREWKGQTQRVVVEGKVFMWNGATYRSLSTIAKAVTGTQWNGWLFFGVKKPPARNKNAQKPSWAHDECTA